MAAPRTDQAEENQRAGYENTSSVARVEEEHPRSDDERSMDGQSFDERSMAADSWSVKSEYGSTLDGDGTRTDELFGLLPTVEDRGSDGSGEDEQAGGEEGSALGLRSHWDTTYADELANFHEHGDPGEIWFGDSVMDTMVDWTTNLAAAYAEGGQIDLQIAVAAGSNCTAGRAAGWRVLDLGTGNGVLLHALAKRGFRDLTGVDYSEPAVELARELAQKEGLSHLSFMVDDVLETRLEGHYDLILDKGTLDAVGLHPDGRSHKFLYKQTVEKLLAPGGLLVVTSCNCTKEELVAELTGLTPATPSVGSTDKAKGGNVSGYSVGQAVSTPAAMTEGMDGELPGGEEAADDVENGDMKDSKISFLEFVDQVSSYPTFRFGGGEGTRVCTVAFRRRLEQ
eukprot:TRINITY_DN22255_c0_g1_i1.p1 TRINITY_DN22255_c0_g1~~TRINITY_DN22255_c0_g1_i1.p1  ORF type:complete len:431 (-),score=92.47 TRINITY_DN22255_c0_g1_i1:188-1378(-)